MSFSIILIKLLALNKKKQTNFVSKLIERPRSLDYNTVICKIISLNTHKVKEWCPFLGIEACLQFVNYISFSHYFYNHNFKTNKV